MKSLFEKMIGVKVSCDYAWAAGDSRADAEILLYYALVGAGENS